MSAVIKTIEHQFESIKLGLCWNRVMQMTELICVLWHTSVEMVFRFTYSKEELQLGILSIFFKWKKKQLNCATPEIE